MNETVILLISNILTGVAGFFAGKRRSDAETDNQVLRNLELSSKSCTSKIIDDLKQEIHELNLQVQQLEAKVESLYAENRKLKRHNGL
jgi:outer membrane murein-binding lipoprotein Lpp